MLDKDQIDIMWEENKVDFRFTDAVFSGYTSTGLAIFTMKNGQPIFVEVGVNARNSE